MSDQREGGPFPTIIVGHTELSNTAFELAIRVLVEGADPDVTDPLSIHRSVSSICQDRVYNIWGRMSRKGNSDPKMTRCSMDA